MTVVSERRVLVLGLDGATLDIIRPMVKEGRLPAFARIMREGAHGPLESVASQRSAAAWTSFMTGTNPGRHGIYEFYDYLPETYNLKFIHGAARDGESLWHILSRHGRRVGVVNVPMTFPAEAVNGVLVAGLDCPGIHSRGFTHPAALADELEQTVGEYMIEPGLTGAVVGGRVQEAVDLVRREFEQKMAVARHLMKSRSWDFFTVVLRSLDAVQHTFWKYADAEHPDHDPELHAPHAGVIRDTYEMIDRFLGELMDELDDGRTTLLVMSDHGFGRKHPATGQINAWLASRGYLAFRAAGDAPGGLLRRLYRAVVGRTSRRTKERLWQLFPRLRDRVQSRLLFANIDWSRTRAYSDSLFANIRLNLQGRERDGIVVPGADSEQLLTTLIAELRDLRDPVSGETIVDDVFRREDLYRGPYIDKAPELLVRWREDIPISGIRIEGAAQAGLPSSPPIPGEDPRVVSGDHHLHGIFFGWGPDVAAGCNVTGASIIDLAPTVLHQLGLPVPDNMDGTVLSQIFTPGFLAGGGPAYEEATVDPGAAGPSDTGYDAGEEEAIRDRLRDLGYVE
jgi:predicted AlkP superfamily phosphohydrolase/phosphomutase